ncbi:MAG: hypothetical protein J3K34DRAFT_399040 [Monoraphidium minutum]|nr:MAG: hypothetical protein J3K34DRAFT_399040 [Monoraphidium minutum]
MAGPPAFCRDRALLQPITAVAATPRARRPVRPRGRAPQPAPSQSAPRPTHPFLTSALARPRPAARRRANHLTAPRTAGCNGSRDPAAAARLPRRASPVRRPLSLTSPPLAAAASRVAAASFGAQLPAPCCKAGRPAIRAHTSTALALLNRVPLAPNTPPRSAAPQSAARAREVVPPRRS